MISNEEELKRLKAVKDLNLLDSDKEESYDILTMLIKNIFQVASVRLSLIDDSRVWVKSSCGPSAKQMPRDIAFCGDKKLLVARMIISDLQLDEKYKTHPLVVGKPGFRFYAGFPIRSPEGHVIATLCLSDFKIGVS